MAEITIDIKNLSHEEAVEQVMKVLGLSRSDAEMCVAIERGESHGDIIFLDDQGKEVKRDFTKFENSEK